MGKLVEGLQPADLHRMLGTLLRHLDELARSAFPRLRLEMALLEICEQGPTLPIADLLDAVQNARQVSLDTSKKKTVTPEPTIVISSPEDVPPSAVSTSEPTVAQKPLKGTDVPKTGVTISPEGTVESKLEPAVASRSGPSSAETPAVIDKPKASSAGSKEVIPPTKNIVAKTDNKGASFKKRPSKRSGGYDDFSAPPPKPWADEKCPKLDVKPRRPGASAIHGDADATVAKRTEADKTYSVSEFLSKGETAQERYGALLSVLKSLDTFLASELEQNSHIITFDDGGAQIAIEGTESSLIERASSRLHQIFGTAEGETSGFSWVRCEGGDGRLSTETIFEERQRHAAELLAKRKHDAEDHEAIRLAKQILGGQIVDVLPRDQ